jgi:1-acyl-sn-glycerol-3-phosphate acyltransferase
MMKRLFAEILVALGWKFNMNLPKDLKSFVFIGAPHTSNLDFFVSMAASYFLKRQTHFAIKDSWLKFPMNLILKPLGALAINRETSKSRGNTHTTDVMAELFKDHADLVLMVSPEGTRSQNPHWKSGFYYIAKKAEVPIVVAYADYEKKEAGIGPIIYPTDFQQDMRTIMKFYQGKKGMRPENFKLDERFSSLEDVQKD